MDTSAQAKGSAMIADLANNGGGTYVQRTLESLRPIAGFAVGVGGLAVPVAECTAEVIAFLAKGVAGEYMADYVGTWLDDGIVYIDAVNLFGADDRAKAEACGRFYGQKAIFDFGAKESIDL
jgi:hypothetical protein